MKKVILTLALFAELCTMRANAENAFTINASALSTDATLEVVLYAVNTTTLATVGTTQPILVTSATGILNVDLDAISWAGSAPGGSWAWGYAAVKVTCGMPYHGSTNVCGTMNYNGMVIGFAGTGKPSESCFEVADEDCRGKGDGIGGAMGNSGNENPSYPAVVRVYQ